ncbi:MipA/OmpV family protein [Primorskyibacter sp. 2E107]|uniref:MipA/OmpV family protein n=1 Tax=Primorskyibacter sp. 2E107 TaxID=3403458 RepID=UPI003AF86E17
MRLLLPALILCAASPVYAQDRALAFELGLGVRGGVVYEGADSYEAGPTGTGSVNTFRMLGLNIERGDGLGFGFGPSFRYLAARTADDHPRLTGIEDVDSALEIGGRISYRWENAEVWGAVRKGVTGHEGIVGDLGSDVIWEVARDTELRVGPRMTFANEEYMTTYFGVPAGASLAAYSPGGGLYKSGIEMTIRHDYNDVWAVEGALGWTRLVGDAGDSPVVENRDSGTISLMVIRKFDWSW